MLCFTIYTCFILCSDVDLYYTCTCTRTKPELVFMCVIPVPELILMCVIPVPELNQT